MESNQNDAHMNSKQIFSSNFDNLNMGSDTHAGLME